MVMTQYLLQKTRPLIFGTPPEVGEEGTCNSERERSDQEQATLFVK